MTSKPIFLTLAQVVKIHEVQIQKYGGRPGIRDARILKAILEIPAIELGGVFLNTTIFEMAAAYLYYIIPNHPFIDGNKRTGTMAMLVFLKLNGIDLDIEKKEIISITLRVASGEMTQSEIAPIFGKYIV